MALSPAEVVAGWPALAPLVALDNPPWRFYVLESGELVGEHACASHVEVLYLAQVERVGVVRRPSDNWIGPPVQAVEFTGSVDQAVAALLMSPVPERLR